MIQYGADTRKIEYTYDELGRIDSKTTRNGNLTRGTSYNYVAGNPALTNATTPLVSSISQYGMDFSYTYDNVGNILSETREGVTTTYSYDSLGQLTRVNDPHDTTSGSTGTTWVYNYDLGGNITSKVRYAYTTGTLGTALETIPYSYTDSNWKDKLTAYNGQAITYDAIGNPLSDGTWTYSWQVGRQLAQMSKSGTTVQYQYDANGLRVGKTVSGTETTYTLHGKLLTHLKQGANEMHFYYDAQSRPAMVNFNGTYYTYLHNLQGDIVGLVDSGNNIVVEYKYDAWGKPTLKRSLTTAYDTLATLNPFRYRGYVYDEETGLYYLRNRFYNPVWGRFIGIDDTATLLFKQNNPIQYNLLSYCYNNTINMIDQSGYIPFFAITGIIGALAGGIIGYAKTGTWQGALTGAAIGGVIGLGGGAAAAKLLTGGALANTSAVAIGVKTLISGTGTILLPEWQRAEQFVKDTYRGIRATISTPYGARVVDSLTRNVARESKFGAQGLSQFIMREVQKDAYLVSQGYRVEWHFFRSTVSNTAGPSGPLRRALIDAGIRIVEHYR